MIRRITILSWAALLLLAGGGAPSSAQHLHVNAGALEQIEGSPLYFVNGDRFITNSGYALHLVHADAGPLAGSYQGSLTFTALPATPNTGGPAFGHALPGSRLELEFVELDGPPNAILSLWEEDPDTGALQQRVQAPSGLRLGSVKIPLSENDASPGADPYGHIHGRHFAASKPGLYVAGLRIIDTSANGRNNGPLHSPSAIFPLFIQAGVTLAAIQHSSSQTALFFTKQSGKIYQAEFSKNLSPPSVWLPVGEPVRGQNDFRPVIDPSADGSARFYRLRVIPP